MFENDNDHPFKCNGCGSMYRKHRYAARCCKIGSTDERDEAVREFSTEFEAEAIMADNLKWQEIMDRAHYECSCGESFEEISKAIQCRKCRTYTTEGYCTKVTDRDQDHKIVWEIGD